MKKTIIIAAAFIAILCGNVQAQYNETNNLMYHSFRTPLANDLNPALFPNKTSVYIKLPGIGMQFGSPVAISDILVNKDSVTAIDLNKTFDALGKDNNLHFDLNTEILGFGVKVDNMFFTFGARAVSISNINLPKDLTSTFLHGNVDANGNAISEVNILSGDIFNTTNYVELALGGAYLIEPINLTVGARLKYLKGILNIQTDNTRAVLNTSSDFNNINVDIYYDFLVAGVAAFDTNGKASMANNILKGNDGFSFDIGARYDFGPFTFSFSINDLSAGIHWNNNVYSVHPQKDHVTINYSGQNVTTMFSGGTMNTDSVSTQYSDIIQGLKPGTVKEAADYWYCIPTKFNLGANYSFAKKFRAGLLFHGQLDRGLLSKKNVRSINVSEISNKFRFNTTLSFGANLFNWVELIAGSSIVYDGSKVDFLNPGVGVVFTPGTVFQIYIIGDYISDFYLVDAKDFNFKLGFNLLLGSGNNGRMAQN